MDNPSQIEVLQIKLLSGVRHLKAFADLRIGDWVVRDFRIIRENGGRILIDVPQSSWMNKETRRLQFKAILTLPSELKQEVDMAVLQAYKMAVEKMNGNSF